MTDDSEKTNWYDEYKSAEASFMRAKDEYAELARVLGEECDAWFGDPLASHEEVLARARLHARLVRDLRATTQALHVDRARLSRALDQIGAMLYMDRDGVLRFKDGHGLDEVLDVVNAALNDLLERELDRVVGGRTMTPEEREAMERATRELHAEFQRLDATYEVATERARPPRSSTRS